jgi:HAD superfamily hydrolase (TIGR01509 family)
LSPCFAAPPKNRNTNLASEGSDESNQIAAGMTHPRILVLDAMGVMYPLGDDVRDLLCPFIKEHGGEADTTKIEALYREASLGRRSARDFWRAVGVDPELEEKYLRRFELTPGLVDFLQSPPPHLAGVWCLSNDLSEWSVGLRRMFGLEPLFQGFVISGDVGVRKPDGAIYRHLFQQARVEPQQTIIVDDRRANLDAAKGLGMATVLFTLGDTPTNAWHPTVRGFAELNHFLSSMP